MIKNCLLDNVLFTEMSNYLKGTTLYSAYLSSKEEFTIEEYVYDNDDLLLHELDNTIKLALKKVNVAELFEKMDDFLKMLIIKNYIEEYENEDDLKESIAYYYIQIMFLLNLKDSLLKRFFIDMISEVNDIVKTSLESQEIDIISTLKSHGYLLPIVEVSFDTINYHKGYLLSFIHLKLKYEEQFKVLNKLKYFTDDDWIILINHIRNCCDVRKTEWFIY